MMRPTQEQLEAYVGGQAEIQNQTEGYLFRGEIETITIDGEILKIRFAWLAKGEGYPPIPTSWIMDTNLDYEISLLISNFSDIGNDRLCVNSPIVGEIVVLFPLGGSRLDPSKVEGLVLAPAPADAET